MSEDLRYQIRVLAKKDKSKWLKLLSDTFKMKSNFLAWKYDSNPNFDESLVITTMNKGQVVGCMNWLPRNLKVSKSLSVRAALGADLAVHLDHRGQGLAKPLIASENTILEGKDIVMSYGYIEPQLAERVHHPLLGLVAVPTSTTVYRKYLSLANIRKRVLELDAISRSSKEARRKLPELEIDVLFRLRGIPPFKVKIRPDKLRLEEEDLKARDLEVECDLTLIELLKSKRRTLTVIKALFTRRIKIRGSLRKAIKLYRVFKLVQALLA